MAEAAEADVWLIKQAGLVLVTAGSHDATTAARYHCMERVCVCVCSEHKQAHVAHQRDLPQREGRKKKKKRKEGGRESKLKGWS